MKKGNLAMAAPKVSPSLQISFSDVPMGTMSRSDWAAHVKRMSNPALIKHNPEKLMQKFDEEQVSTSPGCSCELVLGR